MDYKKCYDRIIDRRKAFPLTEEEYGERHHIVPRSLNGSNSSFNIVKLTAREHFICHALLAEIYEKGTVEWHKMNHAFLMMKAGMSKKPRYFNSRLYEAKREDFSETMKFAQSGCKNSQYGKIWVHHTGFEKSVSIQKGLLEHYLNLGYKKGRCAVTKQESSREVLKAHRKLHTTLNSVEGVYVPAVKRRKIELLFGIVLDNRCVEGYKELYNLLTKLYVQDRLSTLQIATQYGTCNGTVRNYLMYLKIARRSSSEANLKKLK